MPLGAFVWMAAIGILTGLVYELGFVARHVCHHKILPTILVDLVFSSIAGVLLVVGLFKLFNFVLSGYAFLAFALGFVLERTTLGFLLAKGVDIVYNRLTNSKKRFAKTKLGKRVFR